MDIHWPTLVNWLAQGLINFGFVILAAYVGARLAHIYERRRDEIRWQNERESLEARMKHERELLEEQLERTIEANRQRDSLRDYKEHITDLGRRLGS